MPKQATHILLVEDNLADATLLFQRFACLPESGCEITHAETLEEAVEIYQKNVASTSGDRPFDLVLLDLGLPDARGLEALTQFQAVIPDVSIVVLTGLDDESLAIQAVAEGAQDYLVKDQITVHYLLRTIRFAIERQQILIQRKQNEDLARQALERERELSELKSSFVDMVSHEFRTPLTIIRTATQLLLSSFQDAIDPKAKRWFEQIETANDQLVHLINDVLTLSQMQSGEFACQPIAFDLEVFCIELAEAISQSLGANHRITLTTQAELRQAFTDANLVRSICTNLLSNAIKYSPQGGEVKFDASYQSGMVTLRIQDCGVGIPEQEQYRLFKRFYRGSNVRSISGTGLGLTIVKRCVEALQGDIAVQSQVNIGTVVTVTFPLVYS
jgi:signal transduction histidine kinase